MRQTWAASRSPTWRRRPPVLRSRRRSCSSSVSRASSRRRSPTRGHRIGQRIAERGARAHRHHGVLPPSEPVRHRLAHPRTLHAGNGRHHLGDSRPEQRVPGLRAGEGSALQPAADDRTESGKPGNTGYDAAFRPRPTAAEVSGRPGNAPATEDRPERRAVGLLVTCGAVTPWMMRQSWANSSPSGPARARAIGARSDRTAGGLSDPEPSPARRGQARIPSTPTAPRMRSYHPASIGMCPKQRSYLLVSPPSSPSVNLHTSCPDRSPPPTGTPWSGPAAGGFEQECPS